MVCCDKIFEAVGRSFKYQPLPSSTLLNTSSQVTLPKKNKKTGTRTRFEPKGRGLGGWVGGVCLPRVDSLHFACLSSFFGSKEGGREGSTRACLLELILGSREGALKCMNG